MRSILPSLTLPATLITLLAATTTAAEWEDNIKAHLPTLGHRNWIVVADSAYPAQVSPGVETIYVGGDQLAAVRTVLRLIRDAPHVRPVAFTDSELPHVAEADAAGISEYRKKLRQILGKDGSTALPHEQIIAELDEAGKAFRVLILKTDLTLPYTSVFFRLDAGYWSDAAEKRLRSRIQDRASRKPNPVFAPIVDDPSLPRVLLIGDSISIGYTLPVREMLAGIANVHRPPTNCGPTTVGLEQLDDWLGDGKWDVIHFNFGLHDLKYINDKGDRVNPKQGHLQVPPDDYAENLTTIIERLKRTGARLIWRTTTPVPNGAFGRKPGMSAEYNAIAANVVQRTLGDGAVVDDQYAFALPRLDQIQRPADVHFTPEGSRLLAKQAVVAIQSQLPKVKDSK